MENTESEYRIKFAFLREVWRDSTISKGAKLLLLDLLLYGGVQGSVFPSQILLANNQGYTDRHIRNLLNELKKRNLITWDRGGYGLSNSYYINEELYFPFSKTRKKMDRKSTSSQLGNPFPDQKGSEFPTNWSQVNGSHQRETRPLSENQQDYE